MTCDESRIDLPAFLDDELDTAGTLGMQKHLAGCADCRGEHARMLALRALLRDDLYQAFPAGFQAQVQSALRRAAEPNPWGYVLKWSPAFAALLILLAAGAWILFNQRSTTRLIARDVLASHVRSLQSDHLIDVAASDRHTVKPWFQGKLDFSPPVPDLAGDGWPLAGGRLDYVDNRPVAALVYRRREHRINAFVWPTTTAPSAIAESQSQGYQILHWNRGGMTWWVISDLDREELLQFAQALQR